MACATQRTRTGESQEKGEGMSGKLLDVQDLRTYFRTPVGVVKAVDGVSFTIGRQVTLGLVGESGCGKSILAQSLLQVQQWPGQVEAGHVLLYGEDGEPPRDLAAFRQKSEDLRRIRGKEISYIHQEPTAALSLLHTVGNQITEALLVHDSRMSKTEARERSITMLTEVGIPRAAERMDSYIFNFSGGMRQRVMIAMALVNHPRLLMADEPTTAVDVTIQAQVLELMKDIQTRYAMSVLFITHNLGILAEIAEEIMVMYLGKIVEKGSTLRIFESPEHPYTKALIGSIPSGEHQRGKLSSIRGTVPDPYFRPSGCTFRDRCDGYMPGKCDAHVPALVEREPGHQVRCFLYSDAVDTADEEYARKVEAGGR
jgi:peptide/nickel transport system ATP-binding protein